MIRKSKIDRRQRIIRIRKWDNLRRVVIEWEAGGVRDIKMGEWGKLRRRVKG